MRCSKACIGRAVFELTITAHFTSSSASSLLIKERLINKGVVYIEEENDLQFIISLFYFFKQRVPILFDTSSKLQLQFIDILNKFLEENGVLLILLEVLIKKPLDICLSPY